MELNWPQPHPLPALARDEVHVWAVRLDVDDLAVSATEERLTAEEVERASKFVLHKPRRNFVVSRAAVRSILGGYLGQPPGGVAIVAQPSGKPRLHVGDLAFNLSHSEDLALVAVTRDCEVGVDVEAVRPIERFEELARRNFHPAEIAAISAADTPTQFFSCWTRKEAVLKAFGDGLRSPLQEFDTLSPASDGGIRVFDTRCYLQAISPAAGYVAAIATLQPRPRCQGFAYSP